MRNLGRARVESNGCNHDGLEGSIVSIFNVPCRANGVVTQVPFVVLHLDHPILRNPQEYPECLIICELSDLKPTLPNVEQSS